MREKRSENNDSIPTIIRQGNNKEKKLKKKKINMKLFRPIMIASILAIVTGSVLGVLMINMFTTVEENVGTTSNPILAGDLDDKEEQKQSANKESVSVKPISLNAWQAYVVQGGVFSNLANAEELVETLDQSGFSSIIWEKDNQYFILLGISQTENGAERLAEEISRANHEVFVKSWETASKSIQLTESEQQWIESIENEWKNTLQTISNGGNFSEESQDKLIATTLEAGQTLNGFPEELATILHDRNGEDASDIQLLLLEIWLLYEELI